MTMAFDVFKEVVCQAVKLPFEAPGFDFLAQFTAGGVASNEKENGPLVELGKASQRLKGFGLVVAAEPEYAAAINPGVQRDLEPVLIDRDLREHFGEVQIQQ